MNRPTITDLAKAAGVSISTVNRLLHGSTAVRQDTIDQILKAAEEIGFMVSAPSRTVAARPCPITGSAFCCSNPTGRFTGFGQKGSSPPAPAAG